MTAYQMTSVGKMILYLVKTDGIREQIYSGTKPILIVDGSVGLCRRSKHPHDYIIIVL